MTLSEVAEDIVVTALGWHWGDEHDALYEYTMTTLLEFLNDKEAVYEQIRSELKIKNV